MFLSPPVRYALGLFILAEIRFADMLLPKRQVVALGTKVGNLKKVIRAERILRSLRGVAGMGSPLLSGMGCCRTPSVQLETWMSSFNQGEEREGEREGKKEYTH